MAEEFDANTKRALESIRANADVSRRDPAEIDRLRMDRLIYTVEDNEKGTLFAHLSERGRRVAR